MVWEAFIRYAGIFRIAGIAWLAMLAAVAAMAGPIPPSALAGPSEPPKEKAERRLAEAGVAKTHAETQKIQHDDSPFWRALSAFGPLLTALIAAGGLFASVKKAGVDRRDALQREASQAKLEAEKRLEAERTAETTRFDERFAKAIEGLSSEKPDAQSGAAVLVASMVREKRAALSDQALQLLLVSLQTEHDAGCERLLRTALERFAKAAPERLVDGLAHIQTSYLNFAYLELPGLDIAFSILRKADFHNAKLTGSRGYKAHLKEANFEWADLTAAQWVKVEAPKAWFRQATLAEARLRFAKLSGADFYRADLRGANLRSAELVGTKFNRSLLAGADFHEAKLDEKTLRSILKSPDWKEAEFDRPVQQELEALAR